MKKILLCKSRRRYCDQTTRCISIICADCEYCEFCDRRIHELKYQLRRHRYGKDDEKSFQSKETLDQLENNHYCTQNTNSVVTHFPQLNLRP